VNKIEWSLITGILNGQVASTSQQEQFIACNLYMSLTKNVFYIRVSIMGTCYYCQFII